VLNESNLEKSKVFSNQSLGLCGELLELKSGVLGTESSKLKPLVFRKRSPACGEDVLMGLWPRSPELKK
jgi:hypothetical protein